MRQLAAFLLFSISLIPLQGSSVYYGGLEDIVGNTGVEKNGDYNDLLFKLTGPNLTLVSGDGQWFTMIAPNEDGSPYWDNVSADGSHMGVGYCLTRTGGCLALAAPAGPNLQYLALPGGSGQPLNFSFTSIGQDAAAFLLEISALSSNNTIGWYDTTDPLNRGVIFSGAQTSGASATFTPSASFGLWAYNGSSEFRSQTALGSVDQRQQHIAMFQVPGQQDVTTPEPASFVMLGAGLVLVAMRLRRKA